MEDKHALCLQPPPPTTTMEDSLPMITEKKTKGWQKIKIKKIQSKSRRNITFTKSQASLFREISHLCSHGDADAALVVVSPMGKVSSFGSPSVDAVLVRLEQNGTRLNHVKGKNPNDREWWDKDISGMTLDELLNYRHELVELKGKLSKEDKNSN